MGAKGRAGGELRYYSSLAYPDAMGANDASAKVEMQKLATFRLAASILGDERIVCLAPMFDGRAWDFGDSAGLGWVEDHVDLCLVVR
jgi:hypothetical protein